MKTAIVTFAKRQDAPEGYPKQNSRDFIQEAKRLEDSLKTANFNGEFICYTDYPKDCPTHSESQFGFKAFCLLDAYSKEYDVILWCDSSVIVKKSILPLITEIKRNGYLFFENSEMIGEFCKDEALVPLGLTREESFKLKSLDASIMGFDCSHPKTIRFLRKLKDFASDCKTFNGPKWSGTRGWPQTASIDQRVKGHRGDQITASIIAYQMKMNRWKTKYVQGLFFVD